MLGLGGNVALYVGLDSVQIIQLQSSGKNKIKLTNFAHIDIFSDNVRPSEETTRNALIITAIQKAMRKCKLSSKEVYTVLPHGAAIVRFFSMPLLPKDERGNAIIFEAKKYIPFRIDEIISDYAVFEDVKQKKMKVIFAAAKIDSIKRHIALLAKAGLRPKTIDIIPFALVRTFRGIGAIDEKKTYAIININPGIATVIIITEGIPYFVRDISLSRAEEWVDDETAKNILDRGISSIDQRTEMKNNLVSELRLSFDYYQKELHSQPVIKIILCGEVGLFDDLDGFLFKQLNVPVEYPNVVKYFEAPRMKLQPRFNPIMPISIGTALNKLIKTALAVDLFRVKEVIQVKKKTFMRKLVFAEVMLIIVCMGILFLIMNASLVKEQNTLRNIEAQRPRLDLSDNNISADQLGKAKEELESRISLYRNMVVKRNPWTPKLNEIIKLLPPQAWITSISVQDIMGQEGGSSKDMVLAGAIYTEKTGEETDIINKFIADLKSDEIFYTGFAVINLSSTKTIKVAGYDITKFEIFCSAQDKEAQEAQAVQEVQEAQ